MANFAKITPLNMGGYRNKASAEFVLTACAAGGTGNGVYFPMTERDDKYVLLCENGEAEDTKDVVIKAGNSKVFGSGNDLKINVAAGKTVCVKLDSGRFKNVTANEELAKIAGVDASELKGCVVITGGSTNVKIGVIQMPA